MTAEESARTLLERLERYKAEHPEEPLGDVTEAVLAMVGGLLDVAEGRRLKLEVLEREVAQLERTRGFLQEERLRAVAAEASLAGALDVVEHALVNVRSLTGGDERRMRELLQKHGRMGPEGAAT